MSKKLKKKKKKKWVSKSESNFISYVNVFTWYTYVGCTRIPLHNMLVNSEFGAG